MFARSACWIGAACRSPTFLIAIFCRPSPKKMKPMMNMANAAAAEPIMTRIMCASLLRREGYTFVGKTEVGGLPSLRAKRCNPATGLPRRSALRNDEALPAADHLADEIVEEDPPRRLQ